MNQVKQFLLKKFPTNEYFDCPVPKQYWEVMQEYADHSSKSQKEKLEGLVKKLDWISVEDFPLFKVDEKGNWECTENGNHPFIGAVPTNKGWDIYHFVFEDGTGLCIVGDMENTPSPWEMDAISHYKIIGKPPYELSQPLTENKL